VIGLPPVEVGGVKVTVAWAYPAEVAPMVGAPGTEIAVIENDESDAVALLLMALMTIPEYVPVVVGVPLSVPVVVLKLAQDGIFEILKLVALVAVGVKL
jgi:hypothetical protein